MKKLALTVTLLGLSAINAVHAAEFFCPSGNVTCLIAAINTANSTPEEDTIFLEPGTYTLNAVDNNTDGPNGLPSIRTPIVVDRQFEGATLIERDLAAAPFRIFHIAEGGQLETGVIILYRGGRGVGVQEGGGILNRGQLTFRGNLLENSAAEGGGLVNYGTAILIDARVEQNSAIAATVGGIANFDTLSVFGSLIAQNRAGLRGAGGILNCGRSFEGPFCSGAIRATAEISNSTIEGNLGDTSGNTGGIRNLGPADMTIKNSTILENHGQIGGISNESVGVDPVVEPTLTIINSSIVRNAGVIGGILSGTIINSTISENVSSSPGSVAASIVSSEIQNTIVALNVGRDCSSAISLGNNIIGDITECDILLQPTDLVADPRLGEFVNEEPGGGYFPLLPDSPAINSANPGACPQTDQLGNPRVGICDKGSIEFQGQGPVLTVRRDVIRAGRSIVARWSGIPAPTSTDWIGLYLPGSPNTAFIDWIYVSCSKTPGNPDRRGSCDFPIPDSLAPGTYELRLLANDGFVQLATSNAFTVSEQRRNIALRSP